MEVLLCANMPTVTRNANTGRLRVRDASVHVSLGLVTRTMVQGVVHCAAVLVSSMDSRRSGSPRRAAAFPFLRQKQSIKFINSIRLTIASHAVVIPECRDSDTVKRVHTFLLNQFSGLACAVHVLSTQCVTMLDLFLTIRRGC